MERLNGAFIREIQGEGIPENTFFVFIDNLSTLCSIENNRNQIILYDLLISNALEGGGCIKYVSKQGQEINIDAIFAAFSEANVSYDALLYDQTGYKDVHWKDIFANGDIREGHQDKNGNIQETFFDAKTGKTRTIGQTDPDNNFRMTRLWKQEIIRPLKTQCDNDSLALEMERCTNGFRTKTKDNNITYSSSKNDTVFTMDENRTCWNGYVSLGRAVSDRRSWDNPRYKRGSSCIVDWIESQSPTIETNVTNEDINTSEYTFDLNSKTLKSVKLDDFTMTREGNKTILKDPNRYQEYEGTKLTHEVIIPQNGNPIHFHLSYDENNNHINTTKDSKPYEGTFKTVRDDGTVQFETLKEGKTTANKFVHTDGITHDVTYNEKGEIATSKYTDANGTDMTAQVEAKQEKLRKAAELKSRIQGTLPNSKIAKKLATTAVGIDTAIKKRIKDLKKSK